MKITSILTLVILMSGLVLAAGYTDTTSTQRSTEQIRTQDINTNPKAIEPLRNQITSNLREKMKEGEQLRIEDKRILIKKIKGNKLELTGKDGSLVKTKLQLNNEGNASKLKIKLSNGRNAEIKIMPETASIKALERLRLKNCNETISNCTIELKEVGEGNKTRAVYEAKVKKEFRLFGVFKSEKEITTQIDAETGEEVKTKRPWWSWMASEDEIETE